MSHAARNKNGSKHKSGKKEIICLCNNIARETIEAAISNGAKTLNEIFDATTAGVGPCGGSCRRKLAPILEHYLATGEFALAENANQTTTTKKQGPDDGGS